MNASQPVLDYARITFINLDMEIQIDFNEVNMDAARDAVLRLSVIYPNLVIKLGEAAIIINGVDADQADSFKQAAADQLIRSKFERDNGSLRHILYESLLN